MAVPKKRCGCNSILGVRLSREQKEFLKKFPVYFLVPYIGMRFIDWSALTSAIAAFESSALAALGYANERIGSLIIARSGSGVSGGGAFDLVVDCSGLVMIIMFLALYYSTEIPQRRGKAPRAPWAYLPALFAFNLLRLLVTLVAGISMGSGALQATHFALWWVDSGVVLAAWAHAKKLEISR